MLAALAVMLALSSGCRDRGNAAAAATRDIGLFTSLPILWSEYGEISELLQPDGEEHWAAAVLRERGQIRPLDRIVPLPDDMGLLVMAQPRPLSPDENVALDEWVRAGGRVLLFADPMLTQPSTFILGDRRRPEGTVLLSPILTHWGLTLEFDETQPRGERAVEVLDATMPVNLAGRFAISDAADCRSYGDGLAVRCSVGKGAVLALADAALLETGDASETDDRAAALQALLASITES